MSNVPAHLSACEHLNHTIPISPSTFHRHQFFSTNKAAGNGFCCHGAVCRSASMAAQQAKAPWIINYRLVKQSSASNILMVYVQKKCKLGDDRMVYQALLYSHQYIYIYIIKHNLGHFSFVRGIVIYSRDRKTTSSSNTINNLECIPN